MQEVKDQLLKTAFELLKEELQMRIGSIRDPNTGEFARARIHGRSLDDMKIEVEGSDSLLEVVEKELGLEFGSISRPPEGDGIHNEGDLAMHSDGANAYVVIKDGAVYEGKTESLRHGRYSAQATAIAKIFVDESEDGMFGSPQYGISKLVERTGFSVEDVKDAIHELRNYLRDTAYGVLIAEPTLFAEFDHLFMTWNPADDAVMLADAMTSRENFPTSTAEAAEMLGWEPRRMNPALVYLEERGAIGKFDSVFDSSFVTFRLKRNDATRRFVRSMKP
jgi:hypothetical protein